MTLEEKLEEWKHIGHYSCLLFYGEDTGFDDIDEPAHKRRVRLMGEPVGVLGGARRLWVSDCVKVSNPPTKKEIEDPGYYIWGNDDAVAHILAKDAGEPDPEEEL